MGKRREQQKVVGTQQVVQFRVLNCSPGLAKAFTASYRLLRGKAAWL